MTASIDTEVEDLGRQRPEWQPWLSVVQQALRETADAKWDTVIPERAEPRENKAPVLAGALIALETSWLRRLDRSGCLAPPAVAAQKKWRRLRACCKRPPIAFPCFALPSVWMKAR